MNDRSVRQNLKRLDYLRPVHGLTNVLRLMGSSGLLVTWFVLSFHYLTWPVYVPISILACLIHQRELSEWIHEGSHFNLVSNKRWNDFIIQFFAGFFFANDIKAHRFGHNEHHRQTEFFIDKDPDTRLFSIKNRRHFWLEVLRDVTGLTALKMFFTRTTQRCPNPTPHFMLKLACYQSLLLALCWATGFVAAYIIYYFTLMTLYPLLNRIRLYGQHMEFGCGTGGGSSRTIDAGVIDRVLVTSSLMLYHHEHHVFPDLPFRALVRIPRRIDDQNAYSQNRWGLLVKLYRELPSGRF